MAVGKEIRAKIKSIQSTQKITSAMEMVAASKMKKVQNRMMDTRPYNEKIIEVISHIMQANSEYKHPFMVRKSNIKTVGFIVISSDRGLCGGLNTNLFRHLLLKIQSLQKKNIKVVLSIVGRKAATFFKNSGVEISGVLTNIGDMPKLDDVLGVIMSMVGDYNDNKFDSINVVYNKFVNTMSQDPTVYEILPLSIDNEENKKNHTWDYLYEPESKEVLDLLLKRYIESLFFNAILENIASEQAARMVAMKSASDNANEMIKDLQLVYNKARQAAITQEISEIVSGAAAV